MEDDWWKEGTEGSWLRVRVVPGARSTQITGLVEGRLRIRLAARPIDGQANEELCRFLARVCGVRRAAIDIARGETSRSKDLFVAGLTERPFIDHVEID